MIRSTLVHRLVNTLALLTMTGAVAVAEQPWPSFRGPHGNGQVLEGLPPGDGPPALALRWKRPLGSGYAGISVAEGVLVAAFTAGERDVVAGLDPETGEERWRYDLAPIYRGHDGSHDGPISTPAVARGRVFALGAWGHLAALDLRDGAVLWTTHLVDDLGSEKPMYGFGASPVVVGDTVVLLIGGEEGAVAGFDAVTGEVRWRAVEDEFFAESPIVAELAGRRQVVVLGAKNAVGLDPTDGTVLWSFEHGAAFTAMGALSASPLPLDDDRIVLKLDDDASTTLQVTAAVPSEGGEGNDFGLAAAAILKTRGLTKSYSPPAAWDGLVYGYTGRLLSALDPDTGEILWRSREPGDGFLIAVDGQLAVLTKKGSLHLGDAGADGWRENARLTLFEDHLAWTPPSFAGGSLYLRSLGEIARVDLVRTTEQTAVAAGPALPPELESLAVEVAAADDPAAAVDGFLADRELPLIDGERVLFMWRGEARDVAVAGDMIGMRREEPMHLLPGTDLWWWQAELDRRARISYVFFVDDAPVTDPTHQRRETSTVLGPDMNWRRGDHLDLSWFAMPEWPGLVSGPHRGRLESLTLQIERPAPEEDEQPPPVTMNAQVWLPPGYDDGEERYPVIYVHNPFAREDGEWPETLDRLVGRGVAPVIVAFLAPPRMQGYARGFGDAVVRQIDQRYRTRDHRDARASVGMGWQSFVAAAAAFHNHQLIGVLGVQSFYALNMQMAALSEAMGDADAATVPMRIYLEWGRWDLISPHEAMDMRASSRDAWDLFAGRGWQPSGGEVWDSTDWASWRHRTGVLLETLFPLTGETPPSGLDAWKTGSASER